MTATQDIRKAFEALIDATTGLPNIAYENLKFNPTGEATWIRTKFTVAEIRPAGVGPAAKELYRGLFMADCFGVQNAGPGAVDLLADNVLSIFPSGTQMTEGGKIINVRFAERQGGINDDPWYMVPVTFTWYSYV